MATEPPPPHPPDQTGDEPLPPRPSLSERMGERARRRPHPRFGVSLAAGGAALAVLGTLVVSFDELGADGGADLDATAGTILTLLLIVAGYVALALGRHGPLAAAGATASALAVPFFLFFVTFDSGDAPPFSVDAVLLLSTGAWALAYVLGPSTGRPFFLGAALVGVWLFVIEQVESVFSTPFLFFAELGGGLGRGGPFGGGFGDIPDPGTIGVISVVFGCAYLGLTVVLDGRAVRGVSTPFLVAGLVALVNGFGSLGQELEPGAVGLLLAVTGVAVAYLGAISGRRFTTWIGSVGSALGFALVVGEVVEDRSVTAAGAAFVVAGLVLVALAEALSRGFEEPGEFDDAPYPTPTLVRSGGPPPPPEGPPPADAPPTEPGPPDAPAPR